MSAEIIKEKSKQIIKESQILLNEIDQLNEWDRCSKIVDNITSVVLFLESVVITVETVVKDILKDADIKGETKLEAAANVIDDLISFPIWIEMIDGYVIKIALSIVVNYLNEKYGHDWTLDVK